MDSGYYAACAGFAAQTQALELVAHNLANLGTTGYRGQQATFRSLLAGAGSVARNPLNAAVNNYGVLGGSRVDLSPGSTVAIAAALTDRFHARPESSAGSRHDPCDPGNLTQDAMAGRREHVGQPGSSLVRAGCALHLHRPADLPAARREGLVREAACHLSLAGHRRLPTPGRLARGSPRPVLSRQAKITRLRG